MTFFYVDNHVFSGIITSEIPENTVITDIIKIDRIEVTGNGQNAVSNSIPLPYLQGSPDNNDNFIFHGYETFSKMVPAPSADVPFGIVFVKIDFVIDATESTEIAETFKITYV